jgi:hypothetical protein
MQGFHQPLDGAPSHGDAFTVELQPDLPGTIDAIVGGVHPHDLTAQLLIAHRPRRRRPSHRLVVGRGGDRAAVLGQRGADRLDTPAQPALMAVLVLGDELHE